MLLDHPTFGDVQKYVYLEATIKAVYLEAPDVAESYWDTADLEYENKKLFSHASIRYHCTKTASERANKSLVDSGRGFDVGDKVIVMAEIGARAGLGEEYPFMCVIAHRDGICACTYNYLLIRVGTGSLKPLTPPHGTWKDGTYTVSNPGSHLHEYCTIWDTANRRPASVKNPITNQPYVFPVTVEDIKPVLDGYNFLDEELFTMDQQGDMQSQEPGFTPDWLADSQGNKIRRGASPNDWWTSYDVNANPTLSMLSSMQLSLALDATGVANGTFTRVKDKWKTYVDNISAWVAASPQAINHDTRDFDVKGSDSTRTVPPVTQARLQELQLIVAQFDQLLAKISPAKIARLLALRAQVPISDPELLAEYNRLLADPELSNYETYKTQRDRAQDEITALLGTTNFQPWVVAHDKNMVPLKGHAYHMQMAYGEDEIWVCAKNTYSGMVISPCDAKWKFVRLPIIPPAIGIPNPSLEKLASGGGAGTGSTMADISMALAGYITTASDNNIFSYGTLKRINDGGFRWISHPALRAAGVGSYRLTQTSIPNSPTETTFKTALNSRYEMFDIWYRYDNWMNSMGCSFASWGVDRTWWFLSNAQQWRVKATFIDTPIGSMWYGSPVWEVALWYMSGFSIFSGGPTARRDAPLYTHFTRQTKHSRRVVAQIYIVQRQGVTLWDDPTRRFVVQQLNKGIYDHFTTIPSSDVEKQIKDLEQAIDYNNAMILSLDAVKIARWEVLKNLPYRTPAETSEYTLLSADATITAYKQYAAAVESAQAQLDALPEDLCPTNDIKYVALNGGENDDIYEELTPAEQKSILAERVYVRSIYPGEENYAPQLPLRSNRNEVEIMAAADLYSSLKNQHGQCNPSKQVRDGLLEYEIQKMITKYYADEGFDSKDMSVFTLEMRIV